MINTCMATKLMMYSIIIMVMNLVNLHNLFIYKEGVVFKSTSSINSFPLNTCTFHMGNNNTGNTTSPLVGSQDVIVANRQMTKGARSGWHPQWLHG